MRVNWRNPAAYPPTASVRAGATSLPPQSGRMSIRTLCWGRHNMKTILAVAVLSISFCPSGALAQERAGTAALGALSGAVILGPVGAVAGAVVGYAAGPSIARSWGLTRSEPRYQEPTAKRSTTMTPDKRAPQSAPTPGSATTPTAAQTAAKEVSAPPKNYAGTFGKWNAPPVQGLE